MMKFKTPDREFIKISIDRLTRFKPVYEKYCRVFDDIINKHLISFDKKISSLDLKEKIELTEKIFNSAFDGNPDLKINEIIKEDEAKIFYITKEDELFLNSKLNFKAALELFNLEELPLNLKRLKLQNNLTSNDTRERYSTLFPIKKVVLTEGITEEILLIEFAKILGLDFKKKGIYVLGAGGKNQVARKYYKIVEEIKIPVFILLDSDAKETYNLILPKLRDQDELYMIQSGEFEDILPKNLIKNALNLHFSENLINTEEDFEQDKSAVEELSSCYKSNGWGEFKKAGFAKIVREYLQVAKNPPISNELKIINEKIKSL